MKEMETGNRLEQGPTPDFSVAEYNLHKIELSETLPRDRIVIDTVDGLSYFLQIEQVSTDQTEPANSLIKANCVKIAESHNWTWGQELPLSIEAYGIEFKGSFATGVQPDLDNPEEYERLRNKFSLVVGEQLIYSEQSEEERKDAWLSPVITRIGFCGDGRYRPLEEPPQLDGYDQGGN